MEEYLATGGVVNVDTTIPSTPSQLTPVADLFTTPSVPDGTNTAAGGSESSGGNVEEPQVEECRLLFMDSLGMHPMSVIAKNVKYYLFHEWETRVRSTASTKTDAKDDGTTTMEGCTSGIDKQPLPALEPSFDSEKAAKYFLDCIPHMKCSVPAQPNGYDCGVYVIKYVELVLNAWPTTYLKRVKKTLPYADAKICKTAFKQSDVDNERQNLHALLNGYVTS